MTQPRPQRNPLHSSATGSPGNWFPDNIALIERTLDNLPSGSNTSRPVAVFDFDNTCVFRDVGQAVFRCQLLNLRYRLTPDRLAALLPSQPATVGGKPLQLVTATILDAYRKLWPLIEDDRRAVARITPEYQIFTALLYWFVSAARRQPELGPRYVLPLMAKLLAGFSLNEVRTMAMEIVLDVSREPLLNRYLQVDCPAPLDGIEASYPAGLQPHPEMIALMRDLEHRGVSCYVVSASAEWLVEEAVRLLGFPVAPDRVFGIRVRLDESRVLIAEEVEGYPVTFREGKVTVIREFIGGTPVLIAGDADTDYDMLTLPEVPVRLLINRRLPGLISSLYDAPDIILQGLDLSTGRFRPSRDTISSRAARPGASTA